jgi:hypothetical protein
VKQRYTRCLSLTQERWKVYLIAQEVESTVLQEEHPVFMLGDMHKEHGSTHVIEAMIRTRKVQ